jgi:predicted CXXCH cytochrome family protein
LNWLLRAPLREVVVSKTLQLFIATAVFAALAGCESDIVYRDREAFNPPVDSANGFLGYFSVSAQQTSCGNCHVEKQGAWRGTAHSHAWADLTGSGHAAASCNGCHSVSEKGNKVVAAAGYSTKPDSSYHDVQCESCHGPGYTHASSPGITNTPLAKISIPNATAAFDTSATCASCHTGTHEPFADQWIKSPHSGVVEDVIDEYVSAPATYSSCLACHEGRSALKAWGVNTAYVESSQAITASTAMPITCSVCHDPHANKNEGQLRWPVNDPNPDNNLCMKCHNRRSEPQATSNRGPHAPQGGVLTGTAGWWPPGYDTTATASTHGNPSANTKLCAGCHVNAFTVTDKLTGAFTFQSVGHLFSPDPCLDNTGKPSGDDTCLRPGDGGYSSGSRSFKGCANSGCHSSTTAAENAMASQRGTLKILADQIWKDVNGNQVVVNFGTNKIGSSFDPGDTGLLTQVALSEYNYGDNKISVAEGALYNVELVGERLYPNGDGSYGVHNPFLAQALLAASINALKAQYGLVVSQQVEAILERVNQHLPKERIVPMQTSMR